MLYMVAESSNCLHAICTQEHASTQRDAYVVNILLVLMWDGLAKVCGWLHVACCTQCAVRAACYGQCAMCSQCAMSIALKVALLTKHCLLCYLISLAPTKSA